MDDDGIHLPTVAPSDVSDLFMPSEPDVAFEGFGEEAFGVLDRLRANPHIEQYREEKPLIRTYIKEPFKRYRDDLVVNWILPNGLDLETERNVFSRLLKNDFGAGGCHHHMWLSFYRPDRRRITDIQLAHSLSPEGLRIAVYAGSQAKDAFETARAGMLRNPSKFRAVVNPLLQSKTYTFTHHYGTGTSKTVRRNDAPLDDDLPDTLADARGMAVRTTIPQKDVLALKGELMNMVLGHVRAVWPVYRFFLASGGDAS